MSINSHEAYFATVPTAVRVRLEQIRREVARRVPGAVECIGYKMPAFRQRRIFFYFGAFKNHIGIYPPVTQDQSLVVQTAQYRGPRGNLSFPHDEPLPLALIGQVAVALAEEYSKN